MFLLTRYVESSQTLGRETNIDLNRYEVCDNVDLETVLMEYESYYYIKFSRYPKITKKLTQSGKIFFRMIELLKPLNALDALKIVKYIFIATIKTITYISNQQNAFFNN